jgi:hypothetical protein
MQQTHVSKDLFGIRGSSFEIRVEYSKEYIIVHLPKVTKINRSVLLEMKSLLENWLEFCKTVGYSCIYTGITPEKKSNKLAMMLGFKYIGTNQGYLIYQYGENDG